MSQVDILNYFPLFFWFNILFFIFYFLMFTRFIPLIYSSLKVRFFMFDIFIKEILIKNIFLIFLKYFNNKVFIKNIFLYFFNINLYFNKLNILIKYKKK